MDEKTYHGTLQRLSLYNVSVCMRYKITLAVEIACTNITLILFLFHQTEKES